MSGFPTCSQATVRENIATAIFGPPLLAGMLTLHFLIEHPRVTCVLLGPLVVPLKVLEKVIPKRNPCDRMPV